jgi:hypothetical protein
MRRDFQAVTTSVLKELEQRITRPEDMRALRQAMRRGDVHATIYWFTWICADPRAANWLQEMFYFSGPNIGRSMSPIQHHLNTEAAYTDLFSWLAPAARGLLEADYLERYSFATRAKHVLGQVKERDLRTWQRGQDHDSLKLKQIDRDAWDRKIGLRSRWRFKTLPSEHRVKRFAKFLRNHESTTVTSPRARQRLVDPRLDGHSRPVKQGSATRIPDPLMREILNRESQHITKALKARRPPVARTRR